jgi:hypothetical protein
LVVLILTIGCRSSKYDVSHGVFLEPISEELKNEIIVIDLEKSIGVIFPKEYKATLIKNVLENRFTPTENEVRLAEIEINKQYLESDKRFAYYQSFINLENDEWSMEDRQKSYRSHIKSSKKEAVKCINFYRQYIGFIENGQKKLLIQFLDFSDDPYGLKNQLTNSFISGWHGWFETNVRLKEYDFETKRLNCFGWSEL